ncbi:MAG TPA: hypothetical protein PLD18_09095 [Flavobacterium sp.]|nr:hypothetical protein [Flavobacterium sp.]HRA72911.1 hypothetical protein [Flavobacterium sp.]
MPHLLARLRNTPFETIREVLEKDKEFHKLQGMYLEHLWKNVDDENEVLFLFRIDDIENTKTLIQKLHSETLKHNPNADLPAMIYLK